MILDTCLLFFYNGFLCAVIRGSQLILPSPDYNPSRGHSSPHTHSAATHQPYPSQPASSCRLSGIFILMCLGRTQQLALEHFKAAFSAIILIWMSATFLLLPVYQMKVPLHRAELRCGVTRYIVTKPANKRLETKTRHLSACPGTVTPRTVIRHAGNVWRWRARYSRKAPNFTPIINLFLLIIY